MKVFGQVYTLKYRDRVPNTMHLEAKQIRGKFSGFAVGASRLHLVAAFYNSELRDSENRA